VEIGKITVARAFAAALRDAGVGVVTHVPGFGATEAFEAFREAVPGDWPGSFHEEVAYGISQGAALAGTRAATLIKAHGLAKAANAAVDSLCTGTTAGFVIGVFHDHRGAHSDSILDVFALLRGLRLPYRISKPGGVYRETIEALRQSERQSQPVAVVILSDTIQAPALIKREDNPLPPPPVYIRSVPRHVLCPPLAEYQRSVMEARLSGQDWRAIPEPCLPMVPDGLGPEWGPKSQPYLPLFEIFRELRGDLVAGDTGVSSLFAFPPYDAVDFCAYMGGSLPLALGARLTGRQSWAVTGDFAFVAAGHLGLAEAVRRNLPLKVLLLANGMSLSTGGQPVPAEALDAILEGYRPYVRTIRDPSDSAEVRTVLNEAAASAQLQLVVARYERARV
jgi:TPP-dependent indolepyruvate ferredoxin oxidoreductase alpha subunit